MERCVARTIRRRVDANATAALEEQPQGFARVFVGRLVQGRVSQRVLRVWVDPSAQKSAQSSHVVRQSGEIDRGKIGGAQHGPLTPGVQQHVDHILLATPRREMQSRLARVCHAGVQVRPAHDKILYDLTVSSKGRPVQRGHPPKESFREGEVGQTTTHSSRDRRGRVDHRVDISTIEEKSADGQPVAQVCGDVQGLLPGDRVALVDVGTHSLLPTTTPSPAVDQSSHDIGVAPRCRRHLHQTLPHKASLVMTGSSRKIGQGLQQERDHCEIANPRSAVEVRKKPAGE